jgi:formylglycine-generating enzyme required for sulfatase activity
LEIYGEGRQGGYRQKTTPVCGFPANGWGLFDMHGNVWEWCSDWYGDYPAKELKDDKGPASGPGRVLRGGSWTDYPWNCRSAYRHAYTPSYRDCYCGCRVVLCPD